MTKRATLRRAYAVRWYVEGHTLESIGKSLGITKQRVWQYIHGRNDWKALRRIHEEAKRRSRCS